MLEVVNPFFEKFPVITDASWINEKEFKDKYAPMPMAASRGTIGDIANAKKEMSLTEIQGVVAEFLNPSGPAKAQMAYFQSGSTSIDDLTAQTVSVDVRVSAPAMTCDRPHPHKVSSCFPKNFYTTDHQYDESKYMALVDKFIGYMESGASKFTTDANQYLSLHGLGGVVQERPADERSAFPFYDKPFMMQMQSWWDLSGNARTDKKREEIYVKWIEAFRKSLIEDVEGAFINFVDYDLVENPKSTEGKLALLKIYYQDNLEQLRKVKAKYDAHNLFNFRMSIVPAEA